MMYISFHFQQVRTFSFEQQMLWLKELKPFKPQDQNLNSHLLPLHTSYKIGGERL